MISTPAGRPSRPWLFLPLVGLLFGLAVTIACLSWVGRPFAGFRVAPFEVVSFATQPDWSGMRAGLHTDMRLITVNGQSFASINSLRERVLSAAPGTPWVYIASDHGRIRQVAVPTETFTWRDFLLTDCPLLALGFLFPLFGALAYWVRPQDDGARVHLIWSSLMGMVFVNLLDRDASRLVPWLEYPLSFLLAAATCHLAIVFPRPFSWARPGSRGVIALYGLLGAAGLGMAAYQIQALGHYAMAPADTFVTFTHWDLTAMFASALGLLAAIGWKTLRAGSPQARRRGAVVLWGALVGFGPLLLGWVFPYVAGWTNPWRAYNYTAALALACFPASIAVAIVRYNLFDTRVIVKRTLTYALSLGTVLVGYGLLTVAIKALSLPWPGHSEDTVVEACSTALIALTFAAVANLTRSRFERFFERTRFDYQQILGDFSNLASQTVERPVQVQAFEQALEQAFKPHHVTVTLTDGAAAPPGGVPPGELQVALRVGDRALGFVGVGPKRSDQDYASEDRRLLENLAGALALALNAARLSAQLADQARLVRELEIAAELQAGLLAKNLVAPIGTRLAASCTPALEIGGDFYDLVTLDAHRSGVVIGDVAGKGVPAALMMAVALTNFRALAPQEASPAALLGRLNTLLHQQRPSNKIFVTALYMIYDARDGSVLLANAGQPKPLLDGEPVAIKGLPLGVRPATVYREVSLYLPPGSTLAAYSDGLEDLESEAGEPFGLERVAGFFGRGDGREPGALHQALLAALKAHAGAAAAADDLTVIVMQRMAPGEPVTLDTRDDEPAALADGSGHQGIGAFG